VTQQCIDFCAPLTPNGCDCFGCCTFMLPDGSETSVVLQSTCSEETLDECTECVPAGADGCGNECGRCELCPGKTAEDLPDDCGPPTGGTGGAGGDSGTGGTGGDSGTGGTGGPDEPPSHTCDNGEQVCNATSDCPSSYYCSFGCCLVIVQ
jgi:hypothetical protein